MKRLMALVALTILTACDIGRRADLQEEQDDCLYKEAMEDYRSGRLETATKGFEKLLVKNPANASARFQLACLLQDVGRDFVGSYCAYHEYLMQRPESDKAKLAKDRMTLCEKELAKVLAARYGLSSSGAASAEELANVRKDLKAAEARIAESERNLAESLKRIRALSEEKDRLLNAVNGVGLGTETSTSGSSVTEARQLLEETEEEDPSSATVAEAARLSKEADEDEETQSSLLPKRTVAKPAETKKPDAKKEKVPTVERPETYVVQEGDTLYGVAKRFYGSIAVWKKIRDANKAIISTDNRLRVGDTIVLPEP